MNGFGTHYLEVVGTIVVRHSGRGEQPVECVVIRTKAQREQDGTVLFVELTSGHDSYQPDTWFEDWTDDRDNWKWHESGTVGRSVDIAVARRDCDRVLAGDISRPPRIFAVRLGDTWVGVHPVMAAYVAASVTTAWVAPS